MHHKIFPGEPSVGKLPEGSIKNRMSPKSVIILLLLLFYLLFRVIIIPNGQALAFARP